MEKDIKMLQEQIAHLQAEISQLGDELYSQQKEIAALRLDVQKLNLKLKAEQGDGGILTAAEDRPPPHY
ncbi:MAG: SlyX family protein [Candidatus Puniceispirillaceae bacterium]